MIKRQMTAAVPAMVLALTGFVRAADSATDALRNTGALERLAKQSGVYNTSPTGKTPNFVVDPSWPQPLPNNWILADHADFADTLGVCAG
jgi:hypothetical protein